MPLEMCQSDFHVCFLFEKNSAEAIIRDSRSRSESQQNRQVKG